MAIWNCQGYLLGGLGIDAGNTAYADSKGALDGWAQGKAVASFSQYSYTRPDAQSVNAWASGAVHVAMPYDKTTQCDYVMFRNNDIEGRWYYGAVKHREYVNTNSTRLWFDLDYWLTFMDELRDGLGQSFIERTHVKQADDWIGSYPSFKYLVPEDFVPRVIEKPYNEWNTAAEPFWAQLRPSAFVVYAATDETGGGSYGLTSHGGVPTACYSKICMSEGELASTVQAFNSSWPVPFGDTSNPDSIISVTYVPNDIAGVSEPTSKPWNTHMPSRGDITRADGEQYQNAKCFTYPYQFVTVKSPTGQEMIEKFEEVANPAGMVMHYVQGCGGMNAKYRYGNILFSTNNDDNMKFLTLPEYPQIPVRSNTFAQWVGANALGVAFNAAMSGVTLMVGATGLGGMFNNISPGMRAEQFGVGMQGIGNSIGSINHAAHAADTMVGKASAADAVAFDLYRVGFYINRPSDEDLTAVDDYFNKFGYKVMTFAKPNLKVRQFHTYVKTIGAEVKAAVPQDGIDQFTGMLNRGTTFWNIQAGEIGVERVVNPDA